VHYRIHNILKIIHRSIPLDIICNFQIWKFSFYLDHSFIELGRKSARILGLGKIPSHISPIRVIVVLISSILVSLVISSSFSQASAVSPPGITVEFPPDNAVLNFNTVQLVGNLFSADPLIHVAVSIDGGPSNPASVHINNLFGLRNSWWGFATQPLAPGVHTFTVTATDSAGQTGSATQTFTIVPTTPPPPADILVGTSIPPNANLGVPFTGTIGVANEGPGTAENPTLQFGLTPGLQLTQLSTVTGTAFCDGTGSSGISCFFPNMAPGSGTLLAVNVMPTQPGSQHFSGIATASNPDPTPIDNQLIWSLTVNPGSNPVSKLAFTLQPPTTIQQGSPFGVQVGAEDFLGNIVTGATGTVSMVFGANPSGALLSGTMTATLQNGLATFSGLSIDKPGTGDTLVATSDVLPGLTFPSNPFNVVPAGPQNIVVKDQATCQAPPVSGTWDAANSNCIVINLTLNPGDLLTVDSSIFSNIKLTITGNLNNAGQVTINNGATMLVASGGQVLLSSGTLNINGNFVTNAGSKVLLVPGNLIVTGGTITISGDLNCDGASSIAIQGGSVTLSGGTLTNNGNVLVTAGSKFSANNGAKVVIQGGIWTLHGDGIIDGTSTVTVSNGGSIGVVGGTFISNGNVLVTAGSKFIAENGAKIVIQGGTTTFNGDGIVDATSTVAVNNGGSMVIQGGNVAIAGTVFTGPGTKIILASGKILVAGGGAQLNLGGDVAIDGSSSISASNNAAVVIQGGNVANAGTVSITDGTSLTLSNGNINIASGGTETIGANGNINIGSGGTETVGANGNIHVGSGGTHTVDHNGSIHIASGGTETVDPGGNIINSGNIANDGNMASAGNMNNMGGGIYNNGGTTALTGNTINGNFATFNNNPSAKLTISSDFTNGGNMASAGDMTLGGGIYTNDGTLTLTGNTVIGSTATVINDPTGLVNIAATAFFNNLGTVINKCGTITGPITGNQVQDKCKPTQISFTGQPTNTEAGNKITPPPEVTAQTPTGGTATSFNGEIDVIFGGNPGGHAQSVSFTAQSGVATLNNIAIDKAGTYTLQATAPDLSLSTTSTPFVIFAGPPTILEFTQQPTDTKAGNAISPAPQVAALDKFNNIATGASGQVSLLFGTDPGGAVLSTTPTATLQNGIATFSGIVVNSAGMGSPFPVGPDPKGVVIADLNGDGMPDIVVANSGGHTGSFLIGHGKGTFGPAQPIPLGSNPSEIAVGDLNGDGKPDIVAANSGDNTVSILIGLNKPSTTGTPRFAEAPSLHVGSKPNAVVVADFNGDGRPDIAAANSGDNSVSVLIGLNKPSTLGIPRFTPASTISFGSSPTALASADLNGVGRSDLVVGLADGSVHVLLAASDGTFTPVQTIQLGGSPGLIKLADVDGDGVPDIIATDPAHNSVHVFLNQKGGTFTPASTISFGSSPTALASADLNGVGRSDLVVGLADGSVHVLLAATAGTFVPVQTFQLGGTPTSMALADLNGDGRPDIVATDSAHNIVDVLINNKDGTFTPAPGYTFDASSVNLQSVTSTAFSIFSDQAKTLDFPQEPPVVETGNEFTLLVAARDAFNNISTGASGSATIAFGANPGGASLNVTPTAVLEDGVAAIPVTIDKQGQGYTFAATSNLLSGTFTSQPFDAFAPLSGAEILNTPVTPFPGDSVQLKSDEQCGPTPCLTDERFSSAWTLVSAPAGSKAQLSSATDASPTFVTDLPGPYQLKVDVIDPFGNIATGSKTITTVSPLSSVSISSNPVTPVKTGTPVSISAAAICGDSACTPASQVSFQWTLVSRPAGSSATLSSTTGELISVTPDVIGTYTFNLIAKDFAGNTAKASASIDAISSRVIITSTTGVGMIFSVDNGAFSRLDALTSSALPTSPPPGFYPYQFFSWRVVGLVGHATEQQIFQGVSPPKGSKDFKLIAGIWKVKDISINGNILTSLFVDNGPYDANSAIGIIEDPEGLASPTDGKISGEGKIGDGIKFEFEVQSDLSKNKIQGSLNFNDKSAKIKLDSENVGFLTLDSTSTGATFVGQATSDDGNHDDDKKKGTGTKLTFFVSVIDPDKTGNHDKFSITVSDSSGNVIYQNSGTVKGHIEIHKFSDHDDKSDSGTHNDKNNNNDNNNDNNNNNNDDHSKKNSK
jgi:hypothetical protein